METSEETSNALLDADLAISRWLFIEWGLVAILGGAMALTWILPLVSPPAWLVWTFWLWTLGAWPAINYKFRRERTMAVFGALARTGGDIVAWALRVTMNYARERGWFAERPAPPARPAGVAALFASGAALEPEPPPRPARAAYAKPPPEDEPPDWPRMEHHFQWAWPLFAAIGLLVLVALLFNRCDGSRVASAQKAAAGARAEREVAQEQTGAVRVAIQEERRTGEVEANINREADHARTALHAARRAEAAPAPSDADFAALYDLWIVSAQRVRDAGRAGPAAPDRGEGAFEGGLRGAFAT